MGMHECSNAIGVFLILSLQCNRYGITKKGEGVLISNQQTTAWRAMPDLAKNKTRSNQ